MTTHKTFNLAMLSVFAMMAGTATAFAEPTTVADVAIYGGNLSVFNDADGSDFSDGSVVGMNARLRNGMFQLDLNSEAVNAGFDYKYSTQAIALHVINPTDFGTLGAMISLGEDGPGEVTVGGAPYTTLALEGARAFGSTTIDAQIGYVTPQDDVYIDSAYYLYLGSVTPVTDSLSVKFNISGARMAEAGTSDYSYLEAMSYGAFAEYAASENFSVYGGVSGSHIAEVSEDEEWSSATVMVGLRIPLGKATTQDLVFADHNPLTGVNHLRLNDWQ